MASGKRLAGRTEAALNGLLEFRSLFEESPDANFLIEDGVFVDCNQSVLDMFGFTDKGSVVGKRPADISPALQVDGFLSSEKSVQMGASALKEGMSRFEWIHRRVNGEEFEAEVVLTALSREGRRLLHAAVRDITVRRRAEDALRVQAQIIDQIHDAVISTDPRGYIMSWNRGAERLYGYSKEDVLGKQISFLYSKDQYDFMLREVIPKLREKGNHDSEIRMVGKSGEEFFVRLSLSLLRDSASTVTGIIGSHIDITEHRKLEEQLRHAHKMQAIGQLAGGIAHDFNNVLTAILGYASLLQMRVKDNPALKAYVDQIFAASDRAASLTQSLLLFGRKQIVSLNPVDVNKIIRKSEKLLSRLISEDVELKTHLFDRELVVLADTVQVEQILMNLATNARDSMPQGGVLSIDTDVVQLDSRFVRSYGYGKPGSYALIIVSDTGAGMEQETAERIFEPFFTTKDVGKGTGLGLSIVYGIVKQHHGYVMVDSKPGKGTKFKIYIPLTKQLANKTRPSQVLPLLEHGAETILVAEDNPEVRKLTSEILRQFGYTVIEAENGEEAIARFRESKKDVKLIILDVVMPKINGKEVYEEATRLDPQVKVLFTSGYTADIISAKGITERGGNFIEKPLQARDLLRRVREMLDQKKTDSSKTEN
jgi:PAS domain S-box-containing protein